MRTITSGPGLKKHRHLAFAILLVPALAVLFAPNVRTAPGTQGQWTTLGYPMPINPVHAALLNNGKVLIVSGSGNVAANTNYRAAVWDRTTNTITEQAVAWDMFCNGMVVLPDGKVLVNSGTLAYDPFKGELRSSVFDPATATFTDIQNMKHGRWYPTVTALGDGRVMTFSGLTETGGTNTAVEILTPGTGWSAEYPAGWTPPLYPRMHLLTDGKVLYSGSGTGSRIFDPATKTWSTVFATTNYSGTRTYGTSVLLPLSPADGYKSRVMIMGGGSPATATTEIIDMSAASPHWTLGPAMSQGRIEMNATILPNGKVLATGGSVNDEDAATKSLNADLYDPQTNTFASAGANASARLYHSNSLLLPDATVALVGGNPTRGSYNSAIEIYSPAYLFNPDSTPATRPTITPGGTPGTVNYGAEFQVQTPDASAITSVVLVRPGAPTHAFDMEQRLVALSFTAGSGALNITAPPNGNVAPPGYYMLFILNAAGVPSVAEFVRVASGPTNQAPTASITSPSANVTINAGQTVSFVGAGTDPDGTINGYTWSFPGGNPSSASVASPPSVTYSTPGTFVASFTVTDNGGLTSAPATRTITVPDFSLGITPSSQAVWPGDPTSYTVTVTPGTGFAGTVNFSVSGLPSGASGSFNPGSVPNSGSTVMSVSTTTATPPGSYPVVITASTGTITHTVGATFVVKADFSLSVSPTSTTLKAGSAGNFNVTVGGTGFTGSVTLSVSGLPKFATGRFAPSTVTGSGNSVLSISTNKNVTPGTYNLTVTAASGGVTHTQNPTLVIQP